MGWIEATSCDLGLDPAISEESFLDGVAFPFDLDFPRASAVDGHQVMDAVRDYILPHRDLQGERLAEPEPHPTSWSCWPCAGLIVSGLAHAALLAALFFLSLHTYTGSADYRGRSVLVHLIDSDPSVPQEESPGTVDSVASIASLAERRRHATSESVKRPPKELSHLVRNDVTSDKEIAESADFPTKPETIFEEKRRDEDKSARKAQKDVDSPSRSDSVSSIPSVASSPRGMLPAAGKEAADFRVGVLSAIEEAAYFPKKALSKGIHGQAVVQFTLHRDGSITGLALVKTSGSEALDQAAVRILERASKRFPQFPEHFPKESVSYVVPIVFRAKSSGGN